MTERLAQILADSFFKILIPGITVTIPLTALSFSISLVISVAVALVQFAQVPVLTKLARLYIWIIRGTPILVQLFVVFYGLPGVGILIEPFPAAVLVFSINEGAYGAETIRAALESVPKGQLEAGQLRGHELHADHVAHHPAASPAHGVPHAGQLLIAMVKGYLSGGQYHRDRNVHDHPAHRRPHLRAAGPLSGGRPCLPAVLHGADPRAGLGREAAEPPRRTKELIRCWKSMICKNPSVTCMS